MKSKCPNCHTMLEINENDYEPGVTVEKECPLCGEFISFDIPEIKESRQVAGPSAEEERIAKLERQLSLMKEQHQSAVEALEDKVQQQNDQLRHQQSQMLSQPTQYNAYSSRGVYVNSRSRTTAGILGIFLGGFGVHKFYLGKSGQGLLYLLFCWTYVSAIVGFIEGIMYLVMSDQEFNDKYNTY